jgi:3-oxoacyl-[acyl-carrier protein] reductase
MADYTAIPDDQVAVVTGGASGLGAAIVRRLHAEGYRVAIADLDETLANALASKLDPGLATARGYRTDVAERAELEGLLSGVLADFGAVHVLVNNAARTQATPLLEITADELEAVLRVNLSGTFQACQVFGAALIAQGYGRIVNIASLAGQNGGTATGGHYASSKGAILTATKVFAREFAAHGVTVNAVSPGPLDSPMVRSIVGEQNLPTYLEGIPVGRLGNPGFIARMVALLASPEATSVTGACWDANGGLYLR